MKTTLTKNQKREMRGEHGGKLVIATVRYDDQCGNGHNTFSITGTVFGPDGDRRGGSETLANGKRAYVESRGCVHDDIARAIPELAPFIKWHLVSSDEPMYYLANTMCHVLAHGATHAWVYFTGPSDPLNVGKTGERLVGYIKADEARKAEGVEGYRVAWDEKTIKAANLDYARSTAVWPDATDADLMQEPEALKAALLARLPALMAEFRKDVESLGFTF